MKIIEAIQRADDLCPNSYTQADKVRWLSIADGQIKREIIDTHEGRENVSFTPYDSSTDVNNTELLAVFPYDELYINWLMAQINYYNGELDDYNNNITDYNEQITSYANWYNRQHMPLNTNIRYF